MYIIGRFLSLGRFGGALSVETLSSGNMILVLACRVARPILDIGR